MKTNLLVTLLTIAAGLPITLLTFNAVAPSRRIEVIPRVLPLNPSTLVVESARSTPENLQPSWGDLQ